MQSDAPISSNPELAQGLPPVSPPSGKFIAQLFLVPFVIVACLVGFTLFVKWFAGSAWTPEEYLERLDNPNEDVRWRAAETLAQVLLREDQLASNPKFVLDLSDRLRAAWQINQAEEKARAEKLPKSSTTTSDPEQPSVNPSRNHMLYLSACLGNVMLPLGAALLSDLAINREGIDPRAVAQRRWRAVWGLANLGENLKRFDKLPPERRQTVLAELAVIAETAGGERADWARKSREYLESPVATRSLQALGVDKALIQCAEDSDPFLREIAAFALNFWEGTARENARIEEVLYKLAADDGHGEDTLAQLRDKPEAYYIPLLSSENEDQALTRVPGLKIRYNATIALARRGSDRVRLDVLQEMLDAKQQQDNFQKKHKNGHIEPDEATITVTMATALRATVDLHRRDPSRDLSELNSSIGELTRSFNATLRNEALRTQSELGLK